MPEYSANQKPFPDGSNASPVARLPPVGIAHSLRFALVVRPWTCLTDGATDTRTIKITKIAVRPRLRRPQKLSCFDVRYPARIIVYANLTINKPTETYNPFHALRRWKF